MKFIVYYYSGWGEHEPLEVFSNLDKAIDYILDFGKPYIEDLKKLDSKASLYITGPDIKNPKYGISYVLFDNNKINKDLEKYIERKGYKYYTIYTNGNIQDSLYNVLSENTKGDTMKNLREANQYTFGGEYGPDVVDAFYDDNKVYKACERFVKNTFGSALKVMDVNVRTLSENIFDLMGDVPADVRNLDEYVRDFVLSDDYQYLIVNPFVNAYVENATFAEEYYTSNDYWDDLSYVALEMLDNSKYVKDMILPDDVEDWLRDNNLNNYDLADYIQRNMKKDVECIIGEKLDKNHIILWETEVGEQEYQVDDDLYRAYKNLDKTTQDVIEGEVEFQSDVAFKKGEYLIINSNRLVSYVIDWNKYDDDIIRGLSKKL